MSGRFELERVRVTGSRLYFVGVMVTRLLILRTWAAVELLIIFQIAFGHVKIQYRLILKLFYNECTHLKCRDFIIKKKNGSSRSACQNIKVCFAQAFEGYCFIHLVFKLRIFFLSSDAFCSNAESVALDIDWPV